MFALVEALYSLYSYVFNVLLAGLLLLPVLSLLAVSVLYFVSEIIQHFRRRTLW